jgi:hypothetical protein
MIQPSESGGGSSESESESDPPPDIDSYITKLQHLVMSTLQETRHGIAFQLHPLFFTDTDISG